MNIDVTKICKTPSGLTEAIDYMIEAQQEVITAIHILDAVRSEGGLSEISESRINKYLEKYEAITAG